MFIADPADPGTWPRTRKPPKGDRWMNSHEEGRWWARVGRTDGQGDSDAWDDRDKEANISPVGPRTRVPGRCTWCRRYTGCLAYNLEGQALSFCGWCCAGQMRIHRARRRRELDAQLAMGHLPHKLPRWYLPPEILASIISAAQHSLQHHQALRSVNGHPSELGA